MDNVVVIAIPFFLALTVVEVIFSKLYKKDFYKLKDSLGNIGTGILNQLAGFVGKPILALIYTLVYTNLNIHEAMGLNLFSTDISTTKGILSWVFAFFWVDLFYYFYHRASHQVNLFWAVHTVHHSSEEYNLSVALRQPIFGFLPAIVFNISGAFIGIPPVMYFVCYGINLLYQFWIHTRFIPKMGFFEKFMNTPSHHRVHHAREEHYLDKNYAGVFIIWDKMFGTFVEEGKEPKYGVYPRFRSFNAIKANMDPISELFVYVKKAKGLKQKFNVLFLGPLWLFENFKKGNIPKTKKLDLNKPMPIGVPIGFLIVLGITIAVLNLKTTLPTWAVATLVSLIFIVMYFIGYAVDKSAEGESSVNSPVLN